MGKVYTKKGDKGQTKTFFGAMSKSDELAEALGAVDELNSWIGYIIFNFKFLVFEPKVRSSRKQTLKSQLFNVQTNLMKINSQLAGSEKKELRITNYEVKKLERWIDKMTGELPALNNFIYPVGEIQVVRAVCRRVERRVVALNIKQKIILKYLNRLSDYLFTLARWVNMKSGVEEEVWKLIQ